jgi:hypothetical protein
LARWRAIE